MTRGTNKLSLAAVGCGAVLLLLLALTPPPAAEAANPYGHCFRGPYYGRFHRYPPRYPILVPVPSYYRPPVYSYYPPASADYPPAPGDDPAAPPAAPQEALPPLPTVSGPLSTPPPGTAVFRVLVPQTWATVLIDGRDTHTMGKERYFVTPRLNKGQTLRYTVSAAWRPASGGGAAPVQQEATLSLQPGQAYTLDLTRPSR